MEGKQHGLPLPGGEYLMISASIKSEYRTHFSPGSIFGIGWKATSSSVKPMVEDYFAAFLEHGR